MPNTPILGLPYPAPSDTADVPRDVQALAEALDGQGGIVPVGCLMLWPSAAPPTGWLVANGQQVNAADYPQLAAILGQAGGLVTLPDMRDRLPIGASASKPLNTAGGSDVLTVAQLPSHNHNGATGAAGAHSHVVSNMWVEALGPALGGTSPTQLQKANVNTDTEAAHTHTVASQGSGQAHQHPYRALNYIIRAG